MKIAIVSDVHLKLRRDKDFELSRFNLLIQNLKQSPSDIIIFNGDLLDNARPTLEEIKAISNALVELKDKCVYIIGGNHEAVTKVRSTYDYLPLNVCRSNKVHKLVIEGITLHLVHWDSIHKIHLIENSDVLISHYRSKVEGLYNEEVDTSFVNNFKLILLGDIHSRYSPATNVFYTGTPYDIAYTKSKEPNGYVMLNVANGEYDWHYVDLDLPKKVRIDVSVDNYKDLKLNAEYLYKIHVTGTLDALKGIEAPRNVTIVKHIEDVSVVKIQTKDVDFFDSLASKVDEMMTTKTSKTKSVLLKIKG